MSAETRRLRLHVHPHLHLPAAVPRVPSHGRWAGLGSVFGKSLRDNRAGMVAVAGILGLMTFAGGWTMITNYGSPATRAELDLMATTLPPLMQGFYGKPVNVATVGGFVSWHYGAYFALFVGLWSLLALSGTLAGEARRGSLELVLATPLSRRAVAWQKLAGHVAALAVVAAVLACIAWLAGALFGQVPADAISPGAALAFGTGVALRGLIVGSIAFALAPLLGRAAAAGIAGSLMVAAYVVNSYRAAIPAFDIPASLSWFAWTADHIPLVGRTDWPSLGLAVLVIAVLAVIGVEVFTRRDVAATMRLPILGLPAALLGTHGPFGRSLGDLLPASVAWGLGLGVYGLVMAATSGAVTDLFKQSPAVLDAMGGYLPGIDLATAAGFLQLAFVDLGFVLIGLVAVTLVAGRSGDETSGRLELQLATPLSRARWASASGLAVLAAIAVVTAILAVAIGAGVALAGDDPLAPAAGTFVLAAYAAGLAGVGLAAGGVFRASLAAPLVLVLTIGTFLIDLLAPALRLPDWVANLALTSHMGQPMVGEWSVPGIAGCLALAVGGLVVGAWGMSRRDVGA